MSKRTALNLLPAPKSLKFLHGSFTLPKHRPLDCVKVLRTNSARDHSEGYSLTVDKNGITIGFREPAGLRAATATFRQLLREYGHRLPCLKIRDWPDFPRRGVMLDISRGRVPKLETLLDLAERLSDLKINELQLYTEHTFAYKKFKSVWQGWGALTGPEIRRLDARCHELGLDLVPNQNSFGHLRYFLSDSRLKKLAEISRPYEAETQDFLRRPTTLAPDHPGTLPFLSGLYDELLPNFTSRFFNIGADETWDLGKGQSKRLCEARGKGRVYLDFLKKLHHEVSSRKRRMMFWGDIILKYPGLIRELPRDLIALNWGYEHDHPFARETARFTKAKIPFYVCPGTSTWQTLIGKHDNALANLRAAAKAGTQSGAIGYLNTDWGDGGHPQPLAVSWPLYAAGAALAWNSKSLDEKSLLAVLSRDIYEDESGKVAAAAYQLGFAHLKLGVTAQNETPIGTVIAAPKPQDRELFCRNGLNWFTKISRQKILATLKEITCQRAVLLRAKPVSKSGKILATELDLAARMAEQSCHYMLWQQAVAAGKKSDAKQLARQSIQQLKHLQKDFNHYWPLRNKATPKHCTPFLQWRIQEFLDSR
jgi:hexosaminidase